MADTKEPETRDSTGRYLPGHGPTGGGRRKLPEQVREMLEAATPKAAKTLIDALDAERAIVVGESVQMVADTDLRLKAANAVLDRLYGKPAQAVTGEDGRGIMASVILLPAVEE